METGFEEKVARARRALEEQDAAWAQAVERIRALGADPIAVTSEALDAIDAATRAPYSPPSATLHAVRG
jgi:hypothetical protein